MKIINTMIIAEIDMQVIL